MMKKIILASASPRRKQLLQQIGLTFAVYPSEIDEVLTKGLSPLQQVEVLSHQKALEVSKRCENALIIAADTMVAYGDEVIGKPKDAKEAQKMLKKLSSTEHSIVTGFTILDTETKKSVTRSTETKIWFRKLTTQEIIDFIKREKPFDKAGGYAIHELAAIFVEKIEGDFFGAVGLPVFLLAKELKKFGIAVI